MRISTWLGLGLRLRLRLRLRLGLGLGLGLELATVSLSQRSGVISCGPKRQAAAPRCCESKPEPRSSTIVPPAVGPPAGRACVAFCL